MERPLLNYYRDVTGTVGNLLYLRSTSSEVSNINIKASENRQDPGFRWQQRLLTPLVPPSLSKLRLKVMDHFSEPKQCRCCFKVTGKNAVRKRQSRAVEQIRWFADGATSFCQESWEITTRRVKTPVILSERTDTHSNQPLDVIVLQGVGGMLLILVKRKSSGLDD